jgi:hypothetical protein
VPSKVPALRVADDPPRVPRALGPLGAPVLRASVCLSGLVLLIALAAPAPAAAKSDKLTERCCFQLSLQASGTETADYGDGTGSYPFFRGKYSASWRFAFRILLKDGHHRGHDHLLPLARNRFRVRSHPRVALHDWTAAWSFSDTPDSVQEACCFTQSPHGWEPACDAHNTRLDSKGFSEEPKPEPFAVLVAGDLDATLLDLPERAGFHCGLNDGRLDASEIELFEAFFPGPTSKQLRKKKDFSLTCSRSVSLGPDGGIRFVGSSANVQMRARFVYFPPSKVFKTAKRLDGLTGTEPPGFKAPASQPNGAAKCKRG